MAVALLGGSVVLLLLLIAHFRINAFWALLVVSFLAGVGAGMSPGQVLAAMLKGVGDTMGALVLILVFGAVLGRIVEESGAARSVSDALIHLLGEKRIQLSVLITGFLVGLPMVYNASFLVLIPLVYTLSSTRRLSLLYVGIPLSSALSAAHGLLVPHPAPVAIASLLHADPNLTLLYGLILAVPAALLAGPVLERFSRGVPASPPPSLFDPGKASPPSLPPLPLSLATLLAPVALMLLGAMARLMPGRNDSWIRIALFLSDPAVALFLGVVAAFALLGLLRGRSVESLMQSASSAAASVSMVALIIAAGGAFKQVLTDAGAASSLQSVTQHFGLPPIWLCWCTSALLRLALGSATVAAITSAGIVAPVISGSAVPPELLVLAIASGSLMFSHFNDIGFWMFKEYYNVSIKDTFRVWTVMESIVALVGLGGVLALSGLLAQPSAHQPKRIAYVNSYHRSYPPSDETMAAIREAFSGPEYDLRVLFLDAKRHNDDSSLRRRADSLAAQIRAFRPGVLVASDDDAVKYVVVPHFLNGPFPIVFCGVNWSSQPYGLPNANSTGIVETVPVDEAVALVRRLRPSSGRRLAVLSEDSTSERNNILHLHARWHKLGLEPGYMLVRDFPAWKAAFLQAQQRADVLYLPTNGAIQAWNPREAGQWVRQHLRIPAFTCDQFMMDFVPLGVVKVAREQGVWAAEAARRILGGAMPSSISSSVNRQSQCLFNPQLAAALHLLPPPDAPCRPWPQSR